MKQGEVWLINLEPTIGSEIRKTRPAVIVNDDVIGKLPLKVIVPITDWKDKYAVAPWMVKLVPNRINKLTKVSTADCFQVRSVSEQRFVKKLGEVDADARRFVRQGLAIVLSIGT